MQVKVKVNRNTKFHPAELTLVIESQEELDNLNNLCLRPYTAAFAVQGNIATRKFLSKGYDMIPKILSEIYHLGTK